MVESVLYVIPAPLLYQAAELLQPPEKLCFVTGLKLSGLLGQRIVVLTQLIAVSGHASRTHVHPHPGSVLSVHHHLLAMGADVEGQFHSHPGRGPEATRASSVDLDTARRWERGAPFLGGIFCEGGRFVRFFNYSQRSEVLVYGNCGKTEDPLCFELAEGRGHTLQSEESGSGRLGFDGSARTPPVVESANDRKIEAGAGWLRRFRK